MLNKQNQMLAADSAQKYKRKLVLKPCAFLRPLRDDDAITKKKLLPVPFHIKRALQDLLGSSSLEQGLGVQGNRGIPEVQKDDLTLSKEYSKVEEKTASEKGLDGGKTRWLLELGIIELVAERLPHNLLDGGKDGRWGKKVEEVHAALEGLESQLAETIFRGLEGKKVQEAQSTATVNSHLRALGWNQPRLQRPEWVDRLLSKSFEEPRKRDLSISSGVLSGKAWGNLPSESRRSIRFMVSSTFTDTVEERNALIADVTPYLQEYARLRRMECLVVEMRWGIRESTAVQTNKICMQELRKCKDESAGLSYVLISCNKYGFRAMPSEIPADEFDKLMEQLDGVMVKDMASGVSGLDTRKTPLDDGPVSELFRLFFELDLNSGAGSLKRPTYVFKSGGKWWQYAVMQKAVRLAASRLWPQDCTEEGLRDALNASRAKSYFISVTEEEICNGLFWDAKRDENAIVYKRRFRGGVPLNAGGSPGMYVDLAGDEVDDEAQRLLENVQEKMLPSVFNGRVKEYDGLEWGPGVNVNLETHLEYIRNFCDDFCDQVCQSIDKANSDLNVQPDELVDEVAHHLRFAKVRVDQTLYSNVTTRLLSPITDYLEQKDLPNTPLVIWGPSGSGKTFVMSSAVGRAVQTSHLREGFVVARFLGTTASSCTSLKLMESLTGQITRLYAQPVKAFNNVDELKDSFFTAMTQFPTPSQPLFVLLDGLDQLDDNDEGRSLQWLLPVITSLPNHVRVVLSTLPDVDGVFHCLTILRSALPSDCLVTIENVSAGREMLTHMLSQHDRTVTSRQMDALCTSFNKMQTDSKRDEGSFLWLRVAAQTASFWKSFENPLPLETTVTGVITQFLGRMEEKHGSHLVSSMMSWTAISTRGLSRTEIQGLLSLNDDVLADIYEWWVPPLRIIPPLLPIRLLHDLESYTASRGDWSGQILLSLFHRKFEEAVMLRYILRSQISLSRRQYGSSGLSSAGSGSASGSLTGSRSYAPLLQDSLKKLRLILKQPSKSKKGVVGAVAIVQDFRHHQMAEYFRGDWAGRPKPYSAVLADVVQKAYPGETEGDRLVPLQPRVHSGHIFSSHSPPSLNFRRIDELVTHLIGSGYLEETIQELCSLEYVSAKLFVHASLDFHHEMMDASEIFSSASDEVLNRLRDYEAFFIKHRHSAFTDAHSTVVLQQALLLPPESVVFADAKACLGTVVYDNHLLLPVNQSYEYPMDNQTDRIKCRVISSAAGAIIDFERIDGHFVAVAEDGAIKIHNLGNGQIVQSLQHHTVAATCVTTISQAETQIVLLTGGVTGQVVKWTGTVLSLSPSMSKFCFSGPIERLCSSVDGSVVLCLCQGKLHFIDATNLTILPQALAEQVTCMDVSLNGEMIVHGSLGCLVRIWTRHGSDWNVTDMSHDFASSKGEVTEVALCHAGGQVTGASGLKCEREILGDQALFAGPIVLWTYLNEAGESRVPDVTTFATLAGHPGGFVTSLSFCAGGSRLLSAANDWAGPRLWDISSLQCLLTCGQQTMASLVMVSMDGLSGVIGDKSGGVSLWSFEDLAASRELTKGSWHTQDVRHLRSCNIDASFFLSSGADKTVRLWSRKGSQIRQLEAYTHHKSDVNRLSISRDLSPGFALAVTSSDDKTVCLWSVNHGQQFTEGNRLCFTKQLVPPDGGWLEAVCIDKSASCIICGDSSGILFVYRISEGDWALHQSLDTKVDQSNINTRSAHATGTNMGIQAICATADGKTMCVSRADGALVCYSQVEGKLFAKAGSIAEAHKNQRFDGNVEVFVDILDDDMTLLSVGDTVLRVWDIETLDMLAEYQLRGDGRRFHVCQERIVVSCWNGWIHVFETIGEVDNIALGSDAHSCRNGLRLIAQLWVADRMDGFIMSQLDTSWIIYGSSSGQIGVWEVKPPATGIMWHSMR